jgi:hypothetical protein
VADRAFEGPLAEYASLRGEIDSRYKYQQQILALQLTLTSAIFALALSKPAPLGILLIVPLSSYLLCGRYIGQRTAIRWIARYIETELSPQVPGGFGWNAWSRANRRPERFFDWYLPLLICFPGAGLLALGWTAGLVFGSTPHSAWTRTGLVLVWLVGLTSATTCAYLVSRVYLKRPTTT